jgi:hypothetical protein
VQLTDLGNTWPGKGKNPPNLISGSLADKAAQFSCEIRFTANSHYGTPLSKFSEVFSNKNKIKVQQK